MPYRGVVGWAHGGAAVRAVRRHDAVRVHAGVAWRSRSFPGWAETLQTLALFLALDLIAAYFAEPVVFGHRTGVSSFALLISALFWIWVWGPIGLLLATPLTVCIAVLGRHVRSLRFLAILFADEPALQPYVRYYQRLLARDEDEAHAVVNRKVSEAGADRCDGRRVDSGADAGRAASFATMRSPKTITTSSSKRPPTSCSNSGPRRRRDDESLLPIVGFATRTPVDQVLLEMLCLAINSTEVRFHPIGADVDGKGAVARAIELASGSGLHRVAVADARLGSARLLSAAARGAAERRSCWCCDRTSPTRMSRRSAARIKEAGADCVVTSIAEALEAYRKLVSDVSAAGGRGAVVEKERRSRLL